MFRGVFENNDPGQRLMVMVNYNTDVSQYWEWSGRGLRPFDDTNEAYKLAVNYLMYSLTHSDRRLAVTSQIDFVRQSRPH